MAGLTLLRVVGNDVLAREEQERVDRETDARQNSELILGLAAYLRQCWDAARIAKRPIETLMLKALRQRNGEYEPDKFRAICAQGGSQVYMMVTEVKCRAAESWLRDILLDQGTPPWDLNPTPIPDLSPKQTEELQMAFAQRVMALLQNGTVPSADELLQIKEMVAQDYRFTLLQAAQARADKMKVKIEDQFAQGGFGDAFSDFISDLVTFPAAFLKGPIVRRQRHLSWVQTVDGTQVEAGERLGPEFERVSPFYIYPEPGVTHINDGYLFEHHPLTRTQLADLIGVPGYDDEAIRRVLDLGTTCSWFVDASEHQREHEERKYHTELRPTAVFDALEFWGKVTGKMLREWGLSETDVPDPAKEYDANVWMVGNFVIKAVLNYDPLGEKPYAKTSFIKRPGAFWGSGIPEIIEDIQNVCNAAARALVNNMGIASGPQVEVNLERIPPNEDITQMVPWKIWQVTNDPLGSGQPAIRFNQPDSRASELMAVYDRFSKMADDHSGIPAYVYGDLNVQGAGRTSSGLSMLMGAAGKGIRQVVMYIDNDVIRPVVQRQFVYNMRYDEDESIKGDAEVVAKGAINLAVKETVNVRRVEFLNATANPIDIEIIGPEGRAALLREVAKGLQMPVDEIIPSRDKMKVNARMAQQTGMAQMAGQMQSQPAPTPTFPGGQPMGGQEGNTVSNQFTGGAG